MLLELAVFVGVVFAVLGGWTMLWDKFAMPRIRVHNRLHDAFGDGSSPRGGQRSLFRELGDADDPEGERAAGLRSRLERVAARAGLDVTLETLATASIVSAVLVGVTVFLLVPHVAAALTGAALAAALPTVAVLVLASRRQSRLAEQLPDAFDLMKRAVRGGQTVSSAMQLVAQQMPAPIAEEFSQCCKQEELGLSPEAVLLELSRRNDSLELRMFTTAMIVHRQCGGSPVELLENLATRIRKRASLRGRVRALTAEGRLQGIVLAALPVVSFLGIRVLNAEYAAVLLEQPRLIVAVLLVECIGVVWIRRIVTFQY